MGTLSVLLPAVLLVGSLSEPRTVNLFDGSREVFESHWKEKKLRRPLTRYEVVEDGDQAVLMARSRKSASAVWRQLKLDPFQTGSITWRWKVARSLVGDQDERQKAGDDYAARVYVFFGRVPFGRKTRGICYVWAGTQPAGSAYPSPYSDHIVTIVVRSGDALAGRWSTEERDLVADYEHHFGGHPEKVFAVGLLVDSDDTGTEATGWFDDIVLRLDDADAGATASASFSHDDWTSVVERFVDATGLVDYEGLAGDRAALDRYLDQVHRISPRSNPERFPTRDDALAYYLNAYNALVFEGVLSRGPESKSVWRGFISGHAFFVRMKITIGGEKTSLKKLEDKTIRKDFADPRIHAALNCASIGCPRLPRKAFDHRRLDEQLDAAMREFVADERHVRFDADARTVHLSKIFDWFKDDFLDHERANGHEKPRLIDYVNRYRAPGAAIPPDSRVRFLEYDKQINRQPPSRTAARAGERNATR